MEEIQNMSTVWDSYGEDYYESAKKKHGELNAKITSEKDGFLNDNRNMLNKMSGGFTGTHDVVKFNKKMSEMIKFYDGLYKNTTADYQRSGIYHTNYKLRKRYLEAGLLLSCEQFRNIQNKYGLLSSPSENYTGYVAESTVSLLRDMGTVISSMDCKYYPVMVSANASCLGKVNPVLRLYNRIFIKDFGIVIFYRELHEFSGWKVAHSPDSVILVHRVDYSKNH